VNEADAAVLMQQAVWAVIVSTGPAILAGTAVGVTIALLQALTQIQEATITFVPKMVAVVAALLLFAPLAASQIMLFTEELYARIESGF
jgi:flagellar biosynthetic protein FliQ